MIIIRPLAKMCQVGPANTQYLQNVSTPASPSGVPSYLAMIFMCCQQRFVFLVAAFIMRNSSFFSVWISLTQNIALGNELLFPGYNFIRKWEIAHVVTRRGFWCFHLLVSQKYQETTGLFRDRYHWKKKNKKKGRGRMFSPRGQ